MDGCLPGNGVRDGVELNQMRVIYRDITRGLGNSSLPGIFLRVGTVGKQTHEDRVIMTPAAPAPNGRRFFLFTVIAAIGPYVASISFEQVSY
jgi:hypothetical protein